MNIFITKKDVMVLSEFILIYKSADDPKVAQNVSSQKCSLLILNGDDLYS